MSEMAGPFGRRGTATAVVHESYSFACMRCGHGWEQSYEIEHHTDTDGHEFVMYVTGGQVVPSPLSKPTCQNCDGHAVRIMRPGRVSAARDAEQRQYHRTPPQTGPVKMPKTAETPEQAETPQTEAGPAQAPEAEPQHHHWHLSDLLHPFQRKAG
ncbi:hypothetical protein ACIRPX_08040 [Streptomyces sp. NPDC101225]|uniref:hypothetical protein n=1 Tax=Streptomyces sp. NPDC101225 TaxID=3366135 RepID=UPI00381123AB